MMISVSEAESLLKSAVDNIYGVAITGIQKRIALLKAVCSLETMIWSVTSLLLYIHTKSIIVSISPLLCKLTFSLGLRVSFIIKGPDGKVHYPAIGNVIRIIPFALSYLITYKLMANFAEYFAIVFGVIIAALISESVRGKITEDLDEMAKLHTSLIAEKHDTEQRIINGGARDFVVNGMFVVSSPNEYSDGLILKAEESDIK